MLKTTKSCRVCQAVKTNNVLLNRIYNSAFFMNTGESLKTIAEDYSDKFSYVGLRNHVQKHQFMSDEDFTNRHLQKISKKAELNIARKKIESNQVWNEVIEQAMGKLQAGELQIRTTDLLKAAKDKSDFEFKKKDQEMAFMEMVWFFTSGEHNREMSNPYDRGIIEQEAGTDNDSAARLTEGFDRGENGPDTVYYPDVGDAATQWTVEIPEGSPEPEV